jgi:hypothetical protein
MTLVSLVYIVRVDTKKVYFIPLNISLCPFDPEKINGLIYSLEQLMLVQYNP